MTTGPQRVGWVQRRRSETQQQTPITKPADRFSPSVECWVALRKRKLLMTARCRSTQPTTSPSELCWVALRKRKLLMTARCRSTQPTTEPQRVGWVQRRRSETQRQTPITKPAGRFSPSVECWVALRLYLFETTSGVAPPNLLLHQANCVGLRSEKEIADDGPVSLHPTYYFTRRIVLGCAPKRKLLMQAWCRSTQPTTSPGELCWVALRKGNC